MLNILDSILKIQDFSSSSSKCLGDPDSVSTKHQLYNT